MVTSLCKFIFDFVNYFFAVTTFLFFERTCVRAEDKIGDVFFSENIGRN